MSQIRVLSGNVSGGRIERVVVELERLGRRTLDRDTVVKWLKDGHTFVPAFGGQLGFAWRLAEGADDALFVRADAPSAGEVLAADALGDLPSA